MNKIEHKLFLLCRAEQVKKVKDLLSSNPDLVITFDNCRIFKVAFDIGDLDLVQILLSHLTKLETQGKSSKEIRLAHKKIYSMIEEAMEDVEVSSETYSFIDNYFDHLDANKSVNTSRTAFSVDLNNVEPIKSILKNKESSKKNYNVNFDLVETSLNTDIINNSYLEKISKQNIGAKSIISNWDSENASIQLDSENKDSSVDYINSSIETKNEYKSYSDNNPHYKPLNYDISYDFNVISNSHLEYFSIAFSYLEPQINFTYKNTPMELKKARNYLKQGKFRDYENLLIMISEKYPDEISPHVGLIKLYLNQRSPDKAINYLNNILLSKAKFLSIEDQANLYCLYGIILGKLNQFEQAMINYHKSLSLNENDDFTYLNILLSAIYCGRLEDSKKWCYRINKKTDNNYLVSSSWYSLALYHRNLGNLNESLICIECAIQKAPNNIVYYALKHHILIIRNEIEKSISVCTKILELDPNSIKFMFILGVTYMSLNKLEEAKECFYKILSIKNLSEHGKFRANIELGKLYSTVNLKESIIHYKNAIEISPNDVEPYISLAWAYYKLKDYNESLEYYRTSIKFKPAESLLHFAQSITLLELNRLKEALSSVEKAIYYNPNAIDALVLKTYICLLIEEFDQAIECSLFVISKDDKNITALNQLLTAYSSTGNYELSINCIDKILALYPENPIHLYNKALLLLYLNKIDEAKNQFSQAILLDNQLKNLSHLHISDYYIKEKEIKKSIEYYNLVLKDEVGISISCDLMKFVMTSEDCYNFSTKFYLSLTGYKISKYNIKDEHNITSITSFLEFALKSTESPYSYLLMLAKYYLLEKNEEEASFFLGQCTSVPSQDFELLYLAARISSKNKSKFIDSIQCYEFAINMLKNQSEISECCNSSINEYLSNLYILKGKVYFLNNEIDNSINCLLEGHNYHPSSEAIRYFAKSIHNKRSELNDKNILIIDKMIGSFSNTLDITNIDNNLIEHIVSKLKYLSKEFSRHYDKDFITKSFIPVFEKIISEFDIKNSSLSNFLYSIKYVLISLPSCEHNNENDQDLVNLDIEKLVSEQIIDIVLDDIQPAPIGGDLNDTASSI